MGAAWEEGCHQGGGEAAAGLSWGEEGTTMADTINMMMWSPGAPQARGCEVGGAAQCSRRPL